MEVYHTISVNMVEQSVELPVIWDIMSMMWRKCIANTHLLIQYIDPIIHAEFLWRNI